MRRGAATRAREGGGKMSEMILGIDIGGTKSAVAMARKSGEILARRALPTEGEPEAMLQKLAGLARDIQTELGTQREAILGAGVAVGGPLDSATGTVYSPPNLPLWKAVPVKAFFERSLGLPVRVDNDANANALAEWKLGAGRGASNLIFMTYGTGIGAGLILNGNLLRGANDLAGEVGHQTILMNGPKCGCGKRGCLEALASGPAIARLARESMMYGRHKRVLALAGGKPGDIEAFHVVEAAKEGDPFAVQILEEAGTYLGVGLANLIQILNPEKIILGTIAVHAGELILGPARRAVAEYAWPRSAAACEIVPAGLGDRSQDLAAIALWLEE